MILDLTKIFKQLAAPEEDDRNNIEKAVYTLKTEFTADCMISQEAANALDVMYDMAADHVSRKELEKTRNEIIKMLDDFDTDKNPSIAFVIGEVVGKISKLIYLQEGEKNGLSENN